jgi:hypothetical protein
VQCVRYMFRAIILAAKTVVVLTLAEWQLVHAMRMRRGLRVAEDDAVGGIAASAAGAVV